MKKLMAIRIDPDVWQQLRIAAVTEKMTMGDYIKMMLANRGEGKK